MSFSRRATFAGSSMIHPGEQPQLHPAFADQRIFSSLGSTSRYSARIGTSLARALAWTYRRNAFQTAWFTSGWPFLQYHDSQSGSWQSGPLGSSISVPIDENTRVFARKRSFGRSLML